MDGIGNKDTNFSENLSEDQRIPDPYPDWALGLGFSWELDIWGKLRHRRESAAANWQALQEEQRLVHTWLVSEIALHYFELMGLDNEQEMLPRNIELQELALELINIQKVSGKVNQSVVDQFEAQLLSTKARSIGTGQNILATESAINRLMGRFPKPIQRLGIASMEGSGEFLQVGVPSGLLQHRPDIRKAEWQLKAASADLHGARAAFYPSLTLGGQAGFNAFDFSKLFLSPGSTAYQLGAGLTAPIFQQGKIKGMFDIASVEQQIALTGYQQALSGCCQRFCF